MVHDKKLEVLLDHLTRCRRFFDLVRWSADVLGCVEDGSDEDEFDRALMSLELARDAIEVELGEARVLILTLIDIQNGVKPIDPPIYMRQTEPEYAGEKNTVTPSPALSC